MNNNNFQLNIVQKNIIKKEQIGKRIRQHVKTYATPKTMYKQKMSYNVCSTLFTETFDPHISKIET